MSTPESPGPGFRPDAFAAACKLTSPLAVRATHRVTGGVQSFTVSTAAAFIGRKQGLHVHLDDPSVSQGHAYLQVVDGLPYCFDLGSRTGVLWDDGGSGGGPVYPDQTLRIGVFDLQISGAAEPLAEGEGAGDPHPSTEAPPLPHLAVLEVHDPNGASGHFALDRPVTLIGRHPGCNLRFLDPEVAYFQCALVVTQAGVWCVTLFSRKGTVVNARPTRVAELRDGALLELGNVSLVFHSGEPSARPLVRSGPLGPVQSSAVAVAPAGAEVLAATLAPLREMMEQFQQSFVAMARMFATMQQEHTAMMCEQMRQLQELMRETRGGSQSLPAPAPPTTPATPTPPAATPAPRVPTPKTTTGPEAEALADAHNWFLERMAKMHQPPGSK